MSSVKSVLLGRKSLMSLYIIWLTMNGIIYHFLPSAVPVLEYLFLVWPVLIVIDDIVEKKIHFSLEHMILWLFLAVVILSVLMNGFTLTNSFGISFIKHITWLCILFSTSLYYEKDSFELTFQRVSFFVVLIVFLLAAASVVCFWTYKAGISLPMGLNAPERIFTYGHYGNEDRFCGLFGYSTFGGNLCCLAIVLSWYLHEATVYNTILTIMLSVLFCYTVSLLDYRTGMIICAFIGVILLFKLLRSRFSSITAALILLFTVAAGCAAVLYLRQDYFSEVITGMKTDPFEALKGFSTGRTEYWYMVVSKLPDHFWLGWGWLNSEALEFYFDAHNLFFNLLMWTGAIGCGTFSFFLLALIARLFMNRSMIGNRKGGWLVVLVACIFIESMLDRAIVGTAENVETAFFWLSAGYLVYLNRTLKGTQDE